LLPVADHLEPLGNDFFHSSGFIPTAPFGYATPPLLDAALAPLRFTSGLFVSFFFSVPGEKPFFACLAALGPSPLHGLSDVEVLFFK